MPNCFQVLLSTNSYGEAPEEAAARRAREYRAGLPPPPPSPARAAYYGTGLVPEDRAPKREQDGWAEFEVDPEIAYRIAAAAAAAAAAGSSQLKGGAEEDTSMETCDNGVGGVGSRGNEAAAAAGAGAGATRPSTSSGAGGEDSWWDLAEFDQSIVRHATKVEGGVLDGAEAAVGSTISTFRSPRHPPQFIFTPLFIGLRGIL